MLELASALAQSSAVLARRLASDPPASAFSDAITVALSKARALSDVGRTEEAEHTLDLLEQRAPELHPTVRLLRAQIGLQDPGI